MVLPVVAAGRAAAAAAETAIGLSMGKSDLDLTRDLFKLQMQQTKRLWTADWAEASVRHGEQIAQSAQQHAESQAAAAAAYFQAEKLAAQSVKLARDQDSRAYEMSWRAEVRESLRDELANQYNRFNIVMLCDTVCLGCVFSLVAEASLPEETPRIMLILYLASKSVSITLFSISLWCAVIVVRRLHEHTAAILERKLFAQSGDLQKVWQRQISLNLPTGPNEIYLVNLAYEKWVAQHLNPIGGPSIHMMAFGVVMMFITAGILTHNIYLIQYNSIVGISIFWSFVFITSTTVLYMKFAEDRKEKRKQGVYDNSWQDQTTPDLDPFTKITRAGKELFSEQAVELASAERTERSQNREQQERDFCVGTKYLRRRVESMIRESDRRTGVRKDVLKLLTTATEEYDALPEELTARLNKMLHEIDEADRRTADLIAKKAAADADPDAGGRGGFLHGLARIEPSSPKAPMSAHPIDAQRIPLSLGVVRNKLGEFSLTTLLRLRNLSDECLRLKSGVQLKQGVYVKSLNVADPDNGDACYHLYPSTEIPPRSEIVVAARNAGIWSPMSGIEGEIVYMNRDETWVFRIRFSNRSLRRKSRDCQVFATKVGEDTVDDQFGTIAKDELDIKANNEVVVSMDVLQGKEGRKALLTHRHSQPIVKAGILLKYRPNNYGLSWLPRQVTLTPTDLVYSGAKASLNKSANKKIALRDISHVFPAPDEAKKNIIEIHIIRGSHPYRFSAGSLAQRDDWIQHILDASNIWMDEYSSDINSWESIQSYGSSLEEGIEVVDSPCGMSVLPFDSSLPSNQPKKLHGNLHS